jgi:hypothetical protein
MKFKKRLLNFYETDLDNNDNVLLNDSKQIFEHIIEALLIFEEPEK